MNIQTPIDIRPLAIVKVALPIALGTFVQFVIVFTDNLFLSKVSSTAMNAAGNSGLLYATLIMTVVGITSGAQILIARRSGEGNKNETGEILANTVVLCLGLAVVLCAILCFVLPELLSFWIRSESLALTMTEFMKMRSPGILFYSGSLAFNAFFVGIARTRILLFTTIVVSLTNVGLNYVLIYGEFGFPEMGVQGAALASVIAEFSSLVVMITYTFKSKFNTEYGLSQHFANPPIKHSRAIIKLGLPLAGQQTLAVMTWTVFFFFVEKLGEIELKVSHIMRSLYILCFVSVFGFSQTTKTYISTLIGQGRQKEMGTVIKRLIMLNVGGVLLMSHGLVLYPEALAGLFTEDEATIQLTKQTMLVVWISVLIHAFSSILLNTLEGSGLTKKALQIEIVSIVFYLVLSWYMTIEAPQPIHIVWMNDFLYFAILGLLSFWVLKRSNWRYNQV